MDQTKIREINGRIAELTKASKTFDEACKKVIDYLHDTFDTYDWTGIYMVEGEHLIATYYRGAPTPHEKIKIGEGVCSMAVELNATVIIPDVKAEPRYLSCSGLTKSEIVVPIIKSGTTVGEIDIDSHQLDAFSEDDKNILERAAYRLSRFYES